MKEGEMEGGSMTKAGKSGVSPMSDRAAVPAREAAMLDIQLLKRTEYLARGGGGRKAAFLEC